MHDLIIGVDVSKDWIDAFDQEKGGRRLKTTPGSLSAFARQAVRRNAFVVFEATGGYDAPLRAALEQAGGVFHRANPARARDFARALGRFAKTDQVDAKLLAEMGARLDLEPTTARPEEERALRALTTRRRQLVEMRKQERTRLQQTGDRSVRAAIARHIVQLDRQIEHMETRINETIAASERFSRQKQLLESAPGLGPVVSATLLAELPELGQLDRRRIASLAGLAPMADDTGKRSGPRRIRGGRPVVRDMLYIAGLVASRCCPRLVAFRYRLLAKGRTPKQAIIAVARRLLVMLNAMMRDGRPFETAHPLAT